MQKNKAQERKLRKKEGKRLIKLVETAKAYVLPLRGRRRGDGHEYDPENMPGA